MAYSVFSRKNMKSATGLNRGLGLQELGGFSVAEVSGTPLQFIFCSGKQLYAIRLIHFVEWEVWLHMGREGRDGAFRDSVLSGIE